MLRSLWASPFLSLLCVLIGVTGPILLAAADENEKSESEIYDPVWSTILPRDAAEIVILVASLFFIRFVEIIFGTKKTIILSLIPLIADIAIKSFLFNIGIEMKPSGPLAVVFTLYLYYCVIYPAAIHRSFGSLDITEKHLIGAALLIVPLILYGIGPIISLLTSLILFLILSPITLPKKYFEKPKTE